MASCSFSDGYELPNHGRQSVLANGSMVIENAHKLNDEPSTRAGRLFNKIANYKN